MSLAAVRSQKNENVIRLKFGKDSDEVILKLESKDKYLHQNCSEGQQSDEGHSS